MHEFLKDIRKELDEIDEELISLFLKRMKLSEEVAKIKHENGGQIFDSQREREKIQKSSKNLTGCEKQEAEAFMQYLMDKSKERQKAVLSELNKL